MPATANSILDDTKKVLGIDADYEVFDLDVTLFINAAFSTLRQLGVGPIQGYSITGSQNLWSEFLGTRTDLNEVKQYVAMKVRMAFDPPATSYALDAIAKMIAEAEWRMNVTVETAPSPLEPTWWDLTGDLPFPSEAKIGDYGYDTQTNKVWENAA